MHTHFGVEKKKSTLNSSPKKSDPPSPRPRTGPRGQCGALVEALLVEQAAKHDEAIRKQASQIHELSSKVRALETAGADAARSRDEVVAEIRSDLDNAFTRPVVQNDDSPQYQ